MGNLSLHLCFFFVKDRQHSIFPCSPSGVNMRTNLPDISIIENSHCIMILQAMLSIMQYFNLQLISLCGASLTASGLQLLVSNSYCIVNEFRFADGHQTSLLLTSNVSQNKKISSFQNTENVWRKYFTPFTVGHKNTQQLTVCDSRVVPTVRTERKAYRSFSQRITPGICGSFLTDHLPYRFQHVVHVSVIHKH